MKSEEDKGQSHEEKTTQGTKKALEMVSTTAPREGQEQE